ncbi:hypothetical protein DPEC_G00062360 [Dallia pectoralis]|uniref:Uncharacterized protein n=1 Tax=Dallia pectoralis TaxID=75939 RepID=A0ACC2H830_DALPE|nr:hypothetical protein DPEC_G00062360 [Dallia pectoralis]
MPSCPRYSPRREQLNSHRIVPGIVPSICCPGERLPGDVSTRCRNPNVRLSLYWNKERFVRPRHQKREEGLRPCIDYRRLNGITRRGDPFRPPPPVPEEH